MTTLHVPPPNVALVHAGKLFYVASPTQVWRMGSTDYETQITDLVEADQLDEAIRLVETLESVLLRESKEDKLREVKMIKAQKLFERRKYEESMALFAAVSAPPERVVKLFPRVIAGDISIWPEEGEEGEKDDGEAEADCSSGEEATGGSDTAAEDHEVEGASKTNGNSKPNGDKNGEPSDPKATREEGKAKSRSTTPELKRTPTTPMDAVGSIRNIAFSRKYGETASIFSFGTRRADDGIHARRDSHPVDNTPRPLEGDELKKAAQELARTYLNEVRRKMTKYFDSEGNAVDPSLILARGSVHEASRKDPLEATFLALDGDGLSSTAEDAAQERVEKLTETCKLVDTTLFLAYMLIRPALVGPLVRIQNQCDPDVVSQKLREQERFDDLVDFLERKQLHRDALELLRFFGQADSDSKAPNLHGPQRTVTYLERLKAEHVDLILEFATWPLRVAPELAMEIFVGDTGNSDTLPRPQVLDFLEKQEQDKSLAVQYLEHIVNVLKDMTPEFHTRLAGLYMTILSQDRAGGSGPDRDVWHARFLGFLESSDQYRAEKVLGWLPRDDPEYYECRAVVLSKMGHHRAALEIYVFKLHDHGKAEAYCMRVHSAKPSSPTAAAAAAGGGATPLPDAREPTAYHILLGLYLKPPPPHRQQLAPALTILSRHGARLDASAALKLIPENVGVKDLQSYFESRIRAANAVVTENRFVAALRKSYIVDVQEQLLDARNSHVTVGEESVCPVCHKRLGLSVIWRLPTYVASFPNSGCFAKILRL